MTRWTLLLLVMLPLGCRRDEPMAGGQPLSHWKREATKVSMFSFWNSDKDERRTIAYRRLSEIGEPAVPALLDLLRHDNVSVSSDAFNALANLGPRAASGVAELTSILDGNAPGSRLEAAWILGSIGPAAEPAVPSLTKLLNDPDERLRSVVAAALGQIGGSGVAALERAGTSADVRLRAASMSGTAARAPDTAARRQALAAGLADPSPEVRLRALDLLSTSRREEAEPLAGYLVQALNDSDPRVRKAAHGVFTSYLQHQRATPRLLAIVLAAGDAEAREEAAWRLGIDPDRQHRDNPEVVDALLNALDDSVANVRIYAGRALAQLESPLRERGVRAIRREIPRVEPIFRVRAARVLWRVSPNVAEVTAVYEAGLQSPDVWHRVETMSAIMDMGKEAEVFIPHFERLRNDPEPEVRERAGSALQALTGRGQFSR